MSLFYEGCQKIFEAISAPRKTAFALTADAGRIGALQDLVGELAKMAEAIQAAIEDLQNQGKTNPDLSRQLMVATFLHNSASQLLALAIDGREEIKAAAAALNDLTGKLANIGKSTKSLIENLGTVASVLDAVGKVTKLATG